VAPIVLAFVLAGGTPSARADDGYQVIVNASSPANELERAEVARFFLRQSLKWTDGHAVLPVDQSARSIVRDFFSKGVLKLPLPAVETYWQRQIFSGRAAPPPVKVTDAEVLAYVASNPGSIGYISPGLNTTPGVKVVKLKE
jgi:ABC-type phosphate transport system substrate-binding protein